MKVSLLVVVLLIALGAGTFALSQVVFNAPATVTGDGAAHAVSSGLARWVIVIADSTNGAAVRIGDSAVSGTRGATVPAGGAFMFPVITPATGASARSQLYDLGAIYYFAATGDKISVVWGR